MDIRFIYCADDFTRTSRSLHEAALVEGLIDGIDPACGQRRSFRPNRVTEVVELTTGELLPAAALVERLGGVPDATLRLGLTDVFAGVCLLKYAAFRQKGRIDEKRLSYISNFAMRVLNLGSADLPAVQAWVKAAYYSQLIDEPEAIARAIAAVPHGMAHELIATARQVCRGTGRTQTTADATAIYVELFGE